MKNYLRSLATRDAGTRMVRLGLIGVVNTIAFFVVFNVLRVVGMSLFWSITIAYAAATFGSYILNRRWTFELVHISGGFAETGRFFGVNTIAWGITVAMVTGADRWFGPLGTVGENVVSLLAASIIIVPKFASYRDLVFHKALRHQSDLTRVVTVDPD